MFSDSVGFVLASKPPQPVTGPTYHLAESSNSHIKISFDPLVSDLETGGSQILSYNLEIDRSDDNFVDVFGGSEIDTYTTEALIGAPLVEEGFVFGFRFRARNVYGWSEWSPVTYALAATVPSTPLAPSFVSATANTISVNLHPSTKANGSPITEYELHMNDGFEGSEF